MSSWKLIEWGRIWRIDCKAPHSLRPQQRYLGMLPIEDDITYQELLYHGDLPPWRDEDVWGLADGTEE